MRRFYFVSFRRIRYWAQPAFGAGPFFRRPVGPLGSEPDGPDLVYVARAYGLPAQTSFWLILAGILTDSGRPVGLSPGLFDPGHRRLPRFDPSVELDQARVLG